MKDFVLSLLSRGYGQIVPDENGHDGRLEVCFEPEDYFNWKSHPPLLRLTSSGHFLGHVEPAPPKTYSTRRGPLILYSEDLALSYQPGTVNRKRKAPSGSKHEVDYHLHTLQDLTGAILAYGKKQSKAGSLAGVTHPLIPDTKHANKLSHMHGKTEEKHNQSKVEKGEQVRYQPCFLCSPRPNRAALGPLPPITKGLVHTESLKKPHLVPEERGEQVRYQAHSLFSPRINRVNRDPLPPITEGLVHIDRQEKSQASDEQITFKTKSQKQPNVKIRRSLGTEADTCRAPMSPISETKAAQAEPADQTKDQTILPHLTDHPKDPNGHEKHRLMKNMSGVGEMCTLRSVYVDSSLDSCPLSRLNYYGGHMEGFRQIRRCGGETKVRRVTTETDPSLTTSYLPPINPPVDSNISTLSKPKINDMGSCEDSPELKVNLPDITPGTTYVNHPEKSVHTKVLLLLPPQKEHLQPPAQHDELHETLIEDNKSCGDMELTEELPERRQDPLSDSTCRIIEMDLGHVAWSSALEKRDQQPPIGPLPPLVGRRGPGKQSSMAVYSQNLHDPTDTTEPQTGNIRGCLPPELRERQTGEAVGTLIMGPDGEIIRLSLWDPAVDTEDHPIMGDVTQGHVLKVVTSEEDLKQPWTILIQDHTRNKGDNTTHNTEATTSDKEQLESTHEVFNVNKPAERIKVKRIEKLLGSYNVVKTRTTTQEEEQDEEEEEDEDEDQDEEDEEQEEDEEEYLGSDNEVCDKAQVFLVYAHANNAEDDENYFGSSDNAVNQETQMFKISSRTRQTKAKRKKHLGPDTEIIQKEQGFRVNPKTKKTNAKRNDNDLGPDNERIQEGQNDSHVKQTYPKRKVYLSSGNEINQNEEVYLPEETIEEQSHSITHRPGRRGEGTTAVQRKTTTLQLETEVTLGSRKSKGAAPAISQKSTQFTPTTDTPGESLSTHGQAEIQTGLPVRAPKGHSKNAVETEDAEYKLLENVKKHKKIKKQTGKPKRKTVQIDKDDETQNSRPFNDTSATSKPKKKKNKEMTEEEKVELTESQDPKVKAKKKKKSQPAFVVGKPRPQEAERIANQVDKPERETYEREVSPYNTEDDELDNSVSQEHNYTETGDDTDADSVCTEMQEAQDSPRSVYSTHRSQYSQLTAQSHPSTHRPSQSRTTSVGTVAQCGPCSPAPLSLIHLPPQLAQHPTSDPLKSESSNKVKISEDPNLKNQTDTKAAALAEKAERRRLEVERKRREKEEEKKREQEKEAIEERMRMELEEEKNRRAEETRLRKIREEEERLRRQEEETERQRREQAEKKRERRQQEEKRRLLERLQRERQEEEKRKAAELERQRLEEEAWREEERIKMSQMQEEERLEYLRRRQEEEEERRKDAEERRRKDEEAARRAEEEARLQAELFARQRAALEEQLKFHRGLFVEAEGLEQTQDISRPWVFSYFTLLKMLGLAESS
nr:trichohyalin [Misgurnus anguillicaudatus]